MSREWCRSVALSVGLAVVAVSALAEDKPPKRSENYEELYARYLLAARDMARTDAGSRPSFDWMANLGLDPRARNVNDIVTPSGRGPC